MNLTILDRNLNILSVRNNLFENIKNYEKLKDAASFRAGCNNHRSWMSEAFVDLLNNNRYEKHFYHN